MPASASQHLIPMIPEFDGSAALLPDFFSKIDLIAKFAKWEDNEKVNIAMLKLKDRASQYANLNKLNEKSYTEFKETLEKQFSTNEDHFAATSRFMSCTQGASEKVSDYALRIKSLALKTIRVYADTAQQEFELKRAEADLLERFIHGLHPSIRPFLTMQAPKTTEDAIQLALKFEASNPTYLQAFNTHQNLTEPRKANSFADVVKNQPLPPAKNRDSQQRGRPKDHQYNPNRQRNRSSNRENDKREQSQDREKYPRDRSTNYDSRIRGQQHKNTNRRSHTPNHGGHTTYTSPEPNYKSYNPQPQRRENYRNDFSTRSPTPQRRVYNNDAYINRNSAYPQCIFCKKTNHPASLCYFKPGNSFQTNRNRDNRSFNRGN